MARMQRTRSRSDFRAISRWNQRVLQRIANGDVKRHVVALLYPMRGPRPRLIRVPADSPFSEEPGSNIWAEDIQTRRWYTRRYSRARLSAFPTDPSFRLKNHYSILTSRCSSTTALNRTIRNKWGLHIRGHVIVIRHAAADMMRLTNVSSGERTFIDLLVRSYFAYQQANDNSSEI
uniref:Binuclear zinc transcription factor n=1 Tax=Ganoderma boninense TaxID=34458 RepID=A0A5K1K2G4_9APHY|nr:Binuclear zinc transcription factor [Ganoderma boninense]